MNYSDVERSTFWILSYHLEICQEELEKPTENCSHDINLLDLESNPGYPVHEASMSAVRSTVDFELMFSLLQYIMKL
jgi:hypothetical protein